MEIPEIALTIANNLESPVIFPSNCHSGAVSRQNCRFVPTPPWGGGRRNPLNPVTLLRIVDVHVMSPVHCVHNEGLGDSTPESAFGTFPEGRGRETCRLSRRSVTCPGIHALVRGRSTETVRARVVPSTGATSVPFFSTIVDRGWPRFAFWPRAVDRETRRDSLLRSSAKNIPFLPFSLSSLFRRL